VTELHGSLHRVVCLSCWSRSSREELDARLRAANPLWTADGGLAVNPDGDVALEETAGFTVANCLACGGLLKPDVVFFGENVPKPRVESCFSLVSSSSALVVLGSSLTVMSGLRYVRHASALGIPVVIVNQGTTRGDSLATARLDAPLGAVLTALVRKLGLDSTSQEDLLTLAKGASMLSERELVGLLYRADWTKLSLSGTVTGAERVVDTVITVQTAEPLRAPWRREDDEDDDEPPVPPLSLFGQWPPWLVGRAQEQAHGARRGDGSSSFWDFEAGGEGTPCSLSVAPGRRFRAEGSDGTWAIGCDGTRMWHWLRDRPAGIPVNFGFTHDDQPQPPYRSLLMPSWLLSGYSLALDGEETVGGRAGVRVIGTPRTVTEPVKPLGRPGKHGGGGMFAPLARWLRLEHWDTVEAVVDAELGILLRCSKRSGDETPAVTEFTSLNVGAPTDASLFNAPAGSIFGGDRSSATRDRGERPADGPADSPVLDALGETLETVSKEAAKAVAGIAAGGLGALIKYVPKGRRVDPFTQATAEDEDAAMPADEQPPEEPAEGAAGAMPDEVLHLLYRSGLAAPSVRATLHHWADLDPVFAAVPQSVRGAGFGGVGFLVDAVRDATREERIGAHHAVCTVAMRSWAEYRIDVIRSIWAPGSGREKDTARTTVADGVRQWQVYRDSVFTGPASPPTSDLADLVDASWLLDRDFDLSGGTEIWVSGRRAYRVTARYRDVSGLGMGWWQRLFFPAIAVVDAETGLILRLTRFKGGRPTLRQELRDVAPLEAGADFGFTPPDGLPVFGGESSREEGQPGTRTWSWNPFG
jgi:hypothetical protein